MGHSKILLKLEGILCLESSVHSDSCNECKMMHFYKTWFFSILQINISTCLLQKAKDAILVPVQQDRQPPIPNPSTPTTSTHLSSLSPPEIGGITMDTPHTVAMVATSKQTTATSSSAKTPQQSPRTTPQVKYHDCSLLCSSSF